MLLSLFLHVVLMFFTMEFYGYEELARRLAEQA